MPIRFIRRRATPWIVAALLVELLGRVVLPRQPHWFRPSQDARLIYELDPSHAGINADGMRQEPLNRDALADAFVIAAIGDSHTFSILADDAADTMPARIGHHLETPADGAHIQVLNFGVPGYDMIQELEVLQSRALPFEPNLVILQYTINDDHLPNMLRPHYPWLNSLMHASVVANTAWRTLLYSDFGRERLVPPVEDYAPDLLLFEPGLVGAPMSRESDPARRPHPARTGDLVPPRYSDYVGRDNLERAVRGFGEICRQHGIPALATGFIDDQDKRLYEEAGFRVYTFFDMFKGRDMRLYGYDPTRTQDHFSMYGNDFLGKALAQYIREHYSLEPPARTFPAATH